MHCPTCHQPLPTRDRILAALPGTGDELAVRVGVSLATVHRHLAQMRREGVVGRRVNDGDGVGHPGVVHVAVEEGE